MKYSCFCFVPDYALNGAVYNELYVAAGQGCYLEKGVTAFIIEIKGTNPHVYIAAYNTIFDTALPSFLTYFRITNLI